jgi:transcription termination factor NusB
MIQDLNKNKKRFTEYNEDPEKNQTLIEGVQRDSEEIIERISTELTEFKDSTTTQVNEIFQTLSDTDISSKFLNSY